MSMHFFMSMHSTCQNFSCKRSPSPADAQQSAVAHKASQKANLFNIYCKVQILLDGIKHRCGCEDKEEIELADESGQVKNLLQNKYHYATELLGEREIYVLLRVTNGEKPSETEFRPLLKDEHIINPKFLAKLGSCQEHKGPSPRMKSRRVHRKSTLDIPTAEGIRNTSPHGSRTNVSPKQSKKN